MSETSSSSSSLSPETRQEIVTLIHEAFQSLNSMPAPPLAAPSQPPYMPPLTGNTAAGETLELTTNDLAYRDYKSLNAIAIPLSTYFSILVSHAETSGKVSRICMDFFKYNAHLIKIASEYEWSAVIAYHMAFFNKRCREMQEGNYSGWGKVDIELRSEHFRKAVVAFALHQVRPMQEI
ncbi:hypothetical protein F5050DRAFT_1712637 [Lentinula boryana]|uniref:Uncharacterized protein n=1 Tax=Lentinula boryana TaxID=40481 RepID=A0ABQ8QB73_9AGAR|nr:hypothetical protein F5050DRAFT_1712637 [Lentinula boryana]